VSRRQHDEDEEQWCLVEKPMANGTTAVCDLLYEHDGMHVDEKIEVQWW
jgi:hypothetical protein